MRRPPAQQPQSAAGRWERKKKKKKKKERRLRGRKERNKKRSQQLGEPDEKEGKDKSGGQNFVRFSMTRAEGSGLLCAAAPPASHCHRSTRFIPITIDDKRRLQSRATAGQRTIRSDLLSLSLIPFFLSNGRAGGWSAFVSFKAWLSH